MLLLATTPLAFYFQTYWHQGSMSSTNVPTESSSSASNATPNTKLLTLTTHILSQQQQLHKEATGDLTILLVTLQTACKWISNVVRKAQLLNIIGLTGAKNVQNENVQKLDVLSNEIMINMLVSSGKSALLVSEENEQAIMVDAEHHGKYCVVFDPLDGSSNIDCGVSVGTIFGIYSIKPGSPGQISDVLRPGREMVAAGYAMYGSSTMIMLSTGQGVNGYTLDSSIGEFILTHPNVQVPARGKIYSINEGNAMYWETVVQEYVQSLKFPSDPKKAPYSARYVGSMVADVHRTLLYGGVFGYPTDKKSKAGKLRVLYECFPMSFLMVHAGGAATTGKNGPVLDLLPTEIHGRSGIWLGSRDDIADIEAAYAKHS